MKFRTQFRKTSVQKHIMKLFPLWFQIIREQTPTGKDLVNATSTLDTEVKDFNDNLASQFSDVDEKTRKFNSVDQHQKILLMHSFSDYFLLSLKLMMRNHQNCRMHVVFFGTLQPDQRQELKNILGHPTALENVWSWGRLPTSSTFSKFYKLNIDS